MEYREYFVKLKPLNSFYFGSTKEFGNKNEEYFLKSNIYPQQTAVLGMLRKKILEDNELLLPHNKRDKEHREKEKKFIGEIKESLAESSFGMIENISTVQIYVDDIPYIFSYRDEYEKEDKKDKFDDEKVLTSKGEKKLYIYNAKNFEGKPRNTTKLEKEDILKSTVEVGINSFKRKKSGDEEKAFFKKERYTFYNKDGYFGFYIKLDNNAKLKNGFVQLGDRHSIFFMEVMEKNIENKEYLDNIFTIENAIFCLSDFYLEDNDFKKILELSEGNLIQNTKFKFISRNEKNEKNTSVSQNLISRGSIFLLGETNKEEILKILDDSKYKNFRKIGLNEYKEGGKR